MENRKTAKLVGVIIGLLIGYALIFIQYDNVKSQLQEYEADEEEIYPCPFCGSEDVELKELCGYYYVRCNDCRATGPSHNPKSTVWYKSTKMQAITIWNEAERH